MTNLRVLDVPAVGSATARLWSERLAVRAVFIVFLVVRLVAFANDPLLEDHDSVSYLQSAKALLSLDPDRIIGLSPDATLFYPFLTAVLGAAVGSIESGARLGSLFLSCLLFSALVVIGKRIATTAEIATGLLLLAMSPFFVRFSYSVLSEPTYVATVYLGIALLLTRLDGPASRLRRAHRFGLRRGLSHPLRGYPLSRRRTRFPTRPFYRDGAAAL